MTDHEFQKMGGLGDDISKGVFRAVLGGHRGGHPGVSGIGREIKGTEDGLHGFQGDGGSEAVSECEE